MQLPGAGAGGTSCAIMATQPHSNRSDLSVIHQLLLLARMIDRRSARDLSAEFDLKLAEWRILSFACENGASTAAEICSAFATDRAEASRAVARLLDEGLIQREQDRRHRLKKRISPTRAGRAVFERAQVHWESYSNDVLQDLTQRERLNIHSALQSMVDRVDRVDDQVREPAPRG
jgi:DNA-binding MarR family transcriptional regulator